MGLYSPHFSEVLAVSTSLPASVLIADNSKLHREVMRDFYAAMGLDVRVAADGIEALAQIEQRRPDLLVLDLIMPRIDGAQICAWIRERDAYRDIPVIILSGILSDEIEGIENIRADAFMAKMPIDRIGDELRSLTLDLISGKRPDRPRMHGFEKMYRREVVQELLLERRVRRDILDSLSEGVVELSSDRRLLRSNRAFERICGRHSSELLSRRLDDVFPDCGPMLLGLMKAIEKGEQVATAVVKHGELDLEIKLHRVETVGDPAAVSTGGDREPVGYTLLVADITQRVRIEKERERLRRRLAQSEKMSAIGHFVAGAAHELNNPLTGVIGYAQLLLEKCPDTPVCGDVQKIIAGGNRCKSIVDNLMTFARKIRSEKTPTDVNALLLEAISSHRESLQQLGAGLELELAPDLPHAVAAPDQLSRALEHVLDNAVSALSEVNGRRWLAISTVLRGERIRIEIRDSGPGIPEESLGRIFDPFFTTRQVGEGSGLGLSVTYGIVADHGGRISASNRPGGGAMLTIELPLEPADARLASGQGGHVMSADERDRRVLIIETEATVVEQLADVLENFDHRIDTASAALDGLRRIQEGDYDLIILDMMMPDMTPDQIFDELARNCPESLDKVIFLADGNPDEVTQRFMARRGGRSLSRPFSIQKIVETVRSVLTS